MAEKVLLCGTGSCCPSVEMAGEMVRIGEEGSGWVNLSKEEWNILVAKIQGGELKAL